MENKIMDNKKTLLIVGGGILTTTAIKIAKEMGLRVVVTDMNPSSPGMKEADVPIVLSTLDIGGHKKLAKELKEKYNFVGVFTAGADFEYTVAEAAKAANLPGIEPEAALKCKNKIIMRDALKKAGIKGPKYKEVTKVVEVLEFAEEVGYPFIIKPVDNSGSRGVKTISSKEEIEVGLNAAIVASSTKTAMVEEYLYGAKQTVEMLVYGGNYHLCNIIDTYHGFAPFAIETGILCPTEYSEQGQKDLYDISVEASMVIGLTLGAAKVDTVITTKGPVVIEMTARLSGGFHCQYLSPMALGTNDIKAAIKLAIGEPLDMEDVTPKWHKFSASRPIFPKPGKIIKIEGVEEAKKINGVKHIILLAKEGDTVREYKDCVARVCFILAVADTIKDVRKICDQAESIIKIQTI